MSYLQWKDEYSVGNSTLDYDHQMLVNIINQLEHAVSSGSSRRVIAQTIESLVRYVLTHFDREETLMRECDYPELHEHIAKHREITETVADIQNLFKRAPEELDAAEVLRFLKTWLVNHILKTDKKYSPYVAGAQQKVAVS